MNCIIDCGQDEHINKRPPGLRVQIGSTGDLEKDCLLATNLERLKSAGIQEVYVILGCTFRPIYNLDAKPLYIRTYTGMCDAMYKFRKYISDTIILDGKYLLNSDLLMELKSKTFNSDILYPVSDKEDFLGLYRVSTGFSLALEDFRTRYFNGVEYNYSESDWDHLFKLEDLFYSVSINNVYYQSSYRQNLYS